MNFIFSKTNSLVFSNSYCESVCFNMPSINTVNITLYKPPGCPLEKFREAMNVINEWMIKQEVPLPEKIRFIGTDDSIVVVPDEYKIKLK